MAGIAASTPIKGAIKSGLIRAAPGLFLPLFSARSRRLMERNTARLGLNALSERVAAATGSRVASGPFADMAIDVAALPVHLAPKLLGTFESELHGAVEAAIARRPDLVLNLGCEAGYYAVGLALRLPGAQVLAHDVDPGARRATARHAALNGVGDRVITGGRVTPRNLERLLAPARAPFLFIDIDGGEAGLLDPEAAPSLAKAALIVETHPPCVPGVDRMLEARFRRTHDVERIEPEPTEAKLATAPRLDIADEDLRLAVDERRSWPTPWLVMTPRRA